ncbi:MAG TPA: riboflavin synthase [Gammaproteobacteria bacterium]|nr:riboflavin synthase [Gammaproteobacteria bacterium]
MFTGIVQAVLPVKTVSPEDGLRRFTIEFPETLIVGLEIGASVSVNGVCLTVIRISQHDVDFEAVSETMRVSNLSAIKDNSMVNIERSAKRDDEVGGHVVSGHVMGTAKVSSIDSTSNNCQMTFALSKDWLRYVFDKGFIAINGASLTVAGVDKNAGTLTVNLIPETLRSTNFPQLGVEDEVNIEIDSQTQAIVETVERVLSERS